MEYQLNDKGFAKWMLDNLPDPMFIEYYNVYQNDVKSALIQRKKIWYGDGMEIITPAILHDLKSELSDELKIQTIIMIAVISFMELFLSQVSTPTEKSDYNEYPRKEASLDNQPKPEESSYELISEQLEIQDSFINSPVSVSNIAPVHIPEKKAEVQKKKESFPKKESHKNAELAAVDEKNDGAKLRKDLSFTDYKFTQPDSFTYKGETYSTKEFSKLYIKVLELLIRDYPEKMSQLAEKYPRWFKYEPFGSVTSQQLSNGIYAGTNYHRYDYAKFLQKIFDDLGLSRDTLIIDSHRDYKGHSYRQNKVSQSMKTEETVLNFNDDWSFTVPVSYTLRGKKTEINTRKWVDMYISVLEDLIAINPYRMKYLPSIDHKSFSNNDFSTIRFKVLSNGIRVARFKANEIKEMLIQIFSYLNLSSADFEMHAEKEAE